MQTEPCERPSTVNKPCTNAHCHRTMPAGWPDAHVLIASDQEVKPLSPGLLCVLQPTAMPAAVCCPCSWLHCLHVVAWLSEKGGRSAVTLMALICTRTAR